MKNYQLNMMLLIYALTIIFIVAFNTDSPPPKIVEVEITVIPCPELPIEPRPPGFVDKLVCTMVVRK